MPVNLVGVDRVTAVPNPIPLTPVHNASSTMSMMTNPIKDIALAEPAIAP